MSPRLQATRATAASTWVLALWLAALPLPGWAGNVSGKVLHVSDGDTLWLRVGQAQRPLKVRILGIDAPEICQPGGPEARQALERLVLGHQVTLLTGPKDVYGRRLAQVFHRRSDVAAELVLQGWAWSEAGRGRGRYEAQEQAARRARRGVFAQPDALPPAQFRRRHGPCLVG